MLAMALATYSMGYRELMNLPMRAFWALSGYVPRVQASRARLDLQLLTAAQSPEGAQGMAEHLALAAPEPIKRTQSAIIAANSVRDEAGVARLRAMVS